MGAIDIIVSSFVLLITVIGCVFISAYTSVVYPRIYPELRPKNQLTHLLGSISDDYIAELYKTVGYYGDEVEFPERLVSKVRRLDKRAGKVDRAFSRYVQKQIEKGNINVKKFDYGKEEKDDRGGYRKNR